MPGPALPRRCVVTDRRHSGKAVAIALGIAAAAALVVLLTLIAHWIGA